MATGPKNRHLCSFCAKDKAEMTEGELMFVSELGGLAAEICSTCVLGFAEAIAAQRTLSPKDFVAFTRLWNAKVAEDRGMMR